jgi:peptidoglycan/xylan/chitin deacetylase (PgdA/CDA1 family)
MKRQLQMLIRSAHLKLFDLGLPESVSLCLHSLEKKHHGLFEECVGFFRDQGYTFTDPSGILNGKGRRVLVSFDDNYKAWYDSLGLLDRLGVRATFYVNSCAFRDEASESEIKAFYERLLFFGERVPLSTDELRAMDRAGHVIASHTHEHHILTELPFDRACEEMRRGKRELERVLGKPVRHFAFPFGMRWCFNPQLRDAALTLGFETIANAIPGLQHRAQWSHDLNRSIWNFERPLAYNVANVRVDGAVFERLTGRSAVG